jgi:CRP-like cAMP-binding protein
MTTLPAHWTFLHERTPADACYVLLEGEVRVLVRGEECAVLGAGSVLGEFALLSSSLRTASVVSSTAIRALRVEYAALSALFRAHPRLRQSMGAAFDSRNAASIPRQKSVADLAGSHRDAPLPRC